MPKWAALLVLAVALQGCAWTSRTIRVLPRCADGLPPIIFTDPACPPDGICGYSCMPDRWKKEPTLWR